MATGTTTRDDTKPPLALIALALIPFAFGYFLSYLFRAVNAVVAPDLVKELGLSASELGLLTSAYLFAFALFQLPLGILLDRYGARRVQAALVFVAAMGAGLFAIGESVEVLTFARALIGLGFAGGLMAGFKAVVVWVPAPRRALANSLVMSAGAIGLLVATAPTEWAVAQFGWRDVILALAALSVASAALILFGVPERSGSGTDTAPLGTQLRELGQIMRDRVFLALVPLLALTAGTQIAIQTLWAGPWLRDVAGLDRAGVADMLALAAIAFLAGVLLSGALADLLQRRGVSLLTTMMGFLVVFFASQVAIVLNITDYSVITWLAFGMSGQVAVLAYPWLSQHFGAHLAGRSNAGINAIMFGCAFGVQYLIGTIIDLYPTPADGRYDPAAYQMAFGVFFGLQIAALLWYVINWRTLRNAERAFGSR
ncbi:MAG: MFS transporter [Pseudomonadota bacterium]